MRVCLRKPVRADCARFVAAVQASRSLHVPWVDPPSSPRAFKEYLQKLKRPDHDGCLVCLRDSQELVGVFNLNNIIRGAFQSAFLGYYGFAPHAGQGLMSEGLQLVLHHAFEELQLHRLEANIQPGNTQSIALVRRHGFVREGFSKAYLKILGQWRDHERWALLSEEFRRPEVQPDRSPPYAPGQWG